MDTESRSAQRATPPEHPVTANRRGVWQAAGIVTAAATMAGISLQTAQAAGLRPAAGLATRLQDATPASGGTLNAAMQGDVVGLDPHIISSYSSTLVTEQVYNGLIQLDENANV